MKDDPAWVRDDGGWWHWPDGATEWQWRPDPPPMNPDQAAAVQAQVVQHYDNAIQEFNTLDRGLTWFTRIGLCWLAVVTVLFFVAQMKDPY